MPPNADERPALYLSDWIASPGDRVRVMASGAGRTRASLVRLRGLIGSPLPTAYREETIASLGEHVLSGQAVAPGSYAIVIDGPVAPGGVAWTWSLRLYPTLVDRGELLDWGRGAVTAMLVEGDLVVTWPGGRVMLPIAPDHWWGLTIAFRPAKGVEVALSPIGNGAWYRTSATGVGDGATEAITGPLRMGSGYSGKLERPEFQLDGALSARWDFADAMRSQAVPATGPDGRTMSLINAPRRATKSSTWTGDAHDWTARPDHYAAIHFHDDDLADCRWAENLDVVVPPDGPSGIFAVRLENAAGVRHAPLFVRPGRRARLCFLAPTLSYLAYGNSVWNGRLGTPWEVEHADEIARARRFGRSVYCRHRDGSGIGLVSSRRPILSFTPGFLNEAIGGQVLLNDDLRILEWLDRLGEPYDIVTDHDLHARGGEPLDGYDVLVTGSHPEYHSVETLDALEAFTGRGGRMIYMGGNGFYWRVSALSDAPHVIELRRAEGGIRTWAEPAGDYVHQSDGRLGGLWRRLGRPPNRLVGVGYSAQGLEQDTRPYVATDAADDPRAAFLFDGVDRAAIGASGPLGAAGGYELDRADPRLGTPPHALVVARTTSFDGLVSPVNEERLTDRLLDADDPLRADLTFFEGPNGGATLSIGSILFAGTLGEGASAERLVSNAVARFLSVEPFEMPITCSPSS